MRRVERHHRGAPLGQRGAPCGLLPARLELTRHHLLPEVTRLALLVQIQLAHLLRRLVQPPRYAIHPHLREQHALRPPEAAERGVGRHVRLAALAGDADVGDLVRAVRVEQRAVHDSSRQVQAVTRVVVQPHVQRQDLTLRAVPHLVLAEECVARASDSHVHVAVQHQRHRLAQVERRDRGAHVEERGARLLTAEAAAHALDLTYHLVARQAERLGDELLVLHGGLRGGNSVHLVVVATPY
mmetsp:Transcript_5665/g.14062  ORF Transcript_5665/g.14062 Transcript_5665/m.14062 type:complete len:241 (-) Transcript_5665:1632-2354(-)